MAGILKAVSQPILHAIAAAAMMAMALTGRYGAAAVIGLGWLLRELAQKDSGNLIAALKSMPKWPWHKHAEWVVPTVAAVFVGYIFNA